MMLKLADMKPGDYAKEVGLSEAKLRELEAWLIERLLNERALPAGAWLVDVKVEVRASLRGTKEEMVRPPGHFWSATVHKAVPITGVELTAAAREVNLTAAPAGMEYSPKENP